MQEQVNVRELLLVADLERQGDDLVAPAQAVLEVAFAVARVREVRAQLETEAIPFRALGKGIDGVEPAAVPADRLLVLAHLLAQQALPREQPDVPGGSLLEQLASLPVGGCAALEAPGEELAL